MGGRLGVTPPRGGPGVPRRVLVAGATKISPAETEGCQGGPATLPLCQNTARRSRVLGHRLASGRGLHTGLLYTLHAIPGKALPRVLELATQHSEILGHARATFAITCKSKGNSTNGRSGLQASEQKLTCGARPGCVTDVRGHHRLSWRACPDVQVEATLRGLPRSWYGTTLRLPFGACPAALVTLPCGACPDTGGGGGGGELDI